jgi:hypothetical protein
VAARNRCGYCLSPQHLVMARLEIENIIPLAQKGSSDESNLWGVALLRDDVNFTSVKSQT